MFFLRAVLAGSFVHLIIVLVLRALKGDPWLITAGIWGQLYGGVIAGLLSEGGARRGAAAGALSGLIPWSVITAIIVSEVARGGAEGWRLLIALVLPTLTFAFIISAFLGLLMGGFGA